MSGSNLNLMLIAVTQLTSTDELMMQNELGIQNSLKSSVLELAKNSFEAGLHGVVCSAQDTFEIKNHINNNFLCVTPGIRPSGTKSNDQKRIMTPNEAIKNGSNHLVIGRPITEANDPKQAYENIIKEISNV